MFTAPDRAEGEAKIGEVIGDAVFYSTGPTSGVPFHIRVATSTAPARPLLPLYPESGFESLWFATDGIDMAWLQYYEPVDSFQWERIELWAAPFETDPDQLSSHQVAVVHFDNPGSHIYAGGGHAVVVRGTMHLYRLDPPGLVADIQPPEGMGWRAGALCVGPETMAIAPELLDHSGGPSGEFSTVMFVRYDELGP